MNEAAFLKQLRQHLPEEIFSWKIADRMTAGVPDLYIANHHGESLWIEVKYRKQPPTRPFRTTLSKGQLFWLNNHHDRQHKVGVVIGTPSGTYVLFDRAWNHPIPAYTRLNFATVIEQLCEKLNTPTNKDCDAHPTQIEPNQPLGPVD